MQGAGSLGTDLALDSDLALDPDLPQFVEVLVDCPGQTGLLTYRLPVGMIIRPGDILSVDFGSRQLGAIAIRLTAELPGGLSLAQIREVNDVVSNGLFPAGYWALLERVADYYYTPLMTAIRVALPPGLLQRSQRRVRLTPAEGLDPAALGDAAQKVLALLARSPSQDYAWSYIQQRVKGADRALRELRQSGWVETLLQTPATAQPKRQQKVTLLNPDPETLTPRQREIVAALQQQGGELWLQDLLKHCKTTAPTLQKLADLGCVAIASEERLRFEDHPVPRDQPLPLTDDQQAALQTINGLQGFAQVLLHGVTGSGKTEVYLQAIAPILKQGKSALVLVPEIGLTPQLTDRFRARFGARVRVYHSALSDGERYDTWRLLLSPEPQVVIGTRSAVFAPLPNLGLVILDEEHDSGYKQEQPAPCYHARMVALWRSQQVGCPLVLGSATPSLETWRSVREPKPTHHYLGLPQRVQARPMPPITLVDMRQELQQGNRSMFSKRLQDALSDLKAQGQQGILFVQRRGHSTFVSCRSCGFVMNCPHCSVSLTYHQESAQRQPLLRCHYCNYIESQPTDCPECASPYFKFFGTGTQRVVETLAEALPDLRLLRFDSDTTRRKGAHRQILQQFAEGKADLLIGTQMLTKGIDLPQVQLVGVLAADGLLNLPDFRASERAVQTLLQVAGRAGRGGTPGQVILQTYSLEHPVIQAVQAYAFESCVEAELQERKGLRYPPFGQLILLRLSSPDEDQVEQAALKMAEFLREAIALADLSIELLGPAPANILRVASRFRWQILLKLPPNLTGTPHPWRLPVEALKKICDRQIRLTIDVDPLNLL
ncbi:MAG: primosomal protein N' [Thermosynechococcaceae cyanobacterium MS004]|nr:primosomal protein N' [Thermosynechococcaceae cyanobacterium MS004]